MAGMAFFVLPLDMQIKFRFCKEGCDVSGFVAYLEKKAKVKEGELFGFLGTLYMGMFCSKMRKWKEKRRQMKVHIYLQATLRGRGSYHNITASLHEFFSYCTISRRERIMGQRKVLGMSVLSYRSKYVSILD